jgi:tRNA-2-methylthio-N6-dimethylallyladenosine synthase
MEEIKHVRSKYNRKHFEFTDSLVNGNLKVFKTLLQKLKEYREEGNDITWSSQWIIRSAKQSPEEDFKLLKESGCQEVLIGIDSFSEKVRYDMGKRFTNDDMWYSFSMLQKYKIEHALMGFMGYPTETEEDHEQTLSIMDYSGYDLSYMFFYSERPGTLAQRRYEDDIPEAVKKRRLAEIVEKQNKLSLESNMRDLGKTFKVLIERESKKSIDDWMGRSSQNKVVVFPKKGYNYQKGDYVFVKVTECTQGTLIGIIDKQ